MNNRKEYKQTEKSRQKWEVPSKQAADFAISLNVFQFYLQLLSLLFGQVRADAAIC